jgi:hypothetical protein
MTDAAPPATPVRPAGRAAAVAGGLVVLGALVVLTTLPALVPLLVLEPQAADIPLVAALLIPVGPALSAAVFAWRKLLDAGEGRPAHQFWRGYRLNWADALRVWVPALALLTLLGVNVVNTWGTDIPAVFGVVGAVVAAVAAAWAVHALVVVSLFSFRPRDVVRLATYFLLAMPLPSLGGLVLVAVAVAAGWALGVWAVLLGSVLTLALWAVERPVAARVERRFVVGAPEAPQAKPWPGLDPDADEDDAEGTGATDEGDDGPDDAAGDRAEAVDGA